MTGRPGLRFLSLFSGLEAASLAWLPIGWECVGVAEIDPFCRALLAQRFPGVPNLGDVTAIDFVERAKALGQIDLVCGGSPCQSFSVAGLRKGLNDDRGNLTLRFVEVVRDLRPEYVVWENVPGILSIDGGAVFENLLDAFLSLGYTVDCDILDAQYFGVAQRRRRVFVVCRRADSLMQPRTSTSALTFASLVAQVSRDILGAPRAACGSDAESLDCRPTSVADGLRRKMLSYSQAGDDCFATWLSNSAGLLASAPHGLACSESGAGRGTETGMPSVPTATATGSSGFEGAADRALLSLNTESSLRSCWVDLFAVVRSYTTSTVTAWTTEEKTWLCLRALVLTGQCTLRWKSCSPISSFVASLLSTVIAEATDYARSIHEPLFDGAGVHAGRVDLLREADELCAALRCVGDEHAESLLSVAQGMRRAPPTRGAKGQGVAADVAPSIGASGRGVSRAGESRGQDPGVACFGGGNTGGAIDVATSQSAKGGTGRHDFESETFVAFHSTQDPITSEIAPCIGQGSKQGSGGIAVAFDERQITSKANRSNPQPGDPCHTIHEGTPPMVVHTIRARGFDASEEGTGRGTPIVPVTFESLTTGSTRVPAVAFQESQTECAPILAFSSRGDGADTCVDLSPTIRACPHAAVAFQESQSGCREYPVAGSLRANGPGHDPSGTRVSDGMAVRRLTPREVERCFSIPDDWTLITMRGAPAADGPRYRACGNSIAVPVLRWIGDRIAKAAVEGRDP